MQDRIELGRRRDTAGTRMERLRPPGPFSPGGWSLSPERRDHGAKRVKWGNGFCRSNPTGGKRLTINQVYIGKTIESVQLQALAVTSTSVSDGHPFVQAKPRVFFGARTSEACTSKSSKPLLPDDVGDWLPGVLFVRF